MTEPLRVLDLFSGIGGFSLGLERTGGFKTVAFCEIKPFPRRVLAKHWPGVPCYEDVRTLTADTLARDGIAVDVITGGFPCQDISVAGKQAGIGDGTRSGLWSEIVRLTRDLRPRYVIVENVTALLSGPSGRPGSWFGRVLGDLASIGYDAEWQVIFAYNVGVPQARPRVWVIAYPSRSCRTPILDQNAFDDCGCSARLDVACLRHADIDDKAGTPSAMSLLGDAEGAEIFDGDGSGKDDGVSLRLDAYKALGNAVVPQIPEMIGRAILAVEANG